MLKLKLRKKKNLKIRQLLIIRYKKKSLEYIAINKYIDIIDIYKIFFTFRLPYIFKDV